MHGREVDDRKRRLHMRSVRSVGTTVASSNSSSLAIVGAGLFTKDGRRISIGDCALFKPLQDNCPPFIGLIRWLTSDKEDFLKLGVNWLYRPAEVKLGKGVSLEAAPNEVFYSFHEDEIPAASLLHPCKVAFLHKCVELPPGTSSFVCRRVYDTTDQCLWWLSDRDYINEQQEDVDLLLNKAQLEMHAAVQSGGRSPKTSNGPTSATQLKPGSDSVQNSSTSLSSQFKGKKRERGDQVSDQIKKERYSKTDDGDSGHCRLEGMLKSEIAKITDKGGLVDNEGVEKLVQLMQPDPAEGKVDLVSRIMLADVISATDRFECLGQFVQLRGLSVLDEWLQEVHNGKIGDSSSPKETDKSVEDFLFALLRALDKLPVNLNALRACPLGKSVNHLRTHKNLEIQKKARSLVETWKKRVEMEMQICDEKSGMTQAVSLPSKAGIVEVSHGGNRRMGASSEVHIKGSIIQASTHKTTSVKLSQGEGTAKSTSTSPGSVKLPTSPASIAVSSKDSHCKTGVTAANSEMPVTIVKGEKSSSSSQSQNNSQSCSSDHVKTVASAWKEDARSSTAGSPNMSKISTGISRHKRSSNASSGTALPGAQKETSLVKLRSVNRTVKSERVSQSGSMCDRALDMPGSEQGSSHRLIVRLPNPGRSPARSATSFDDPSVMVSRASSPGLSEKHDQYDRKLKGKNDYSRSNIAVDVNTESWQSNDMKDGFTGSEGDGSPATIADEQRCRSGEENGKSQEVSRATCSSSVNNKEKCTREIESAKLRDATLSSITALIESCVKYSQANAPVPAGDDGMNLLASVAAGEMSKSDVGSQDGSPGLHSPVPEDSCAHNDSASRLSHEDVISHQGPSDDGAEMDPEQGDHYSSLHVQDGLQNATNAADESKTTSSVFEKKLATCISGMDLKQTLDSCSNSDVKPDEATSSVPLVLSSAALIEGGADSEGANQLSEKRKRGFTSSNGNDSQDFQIEAKSSIVNETNKFDGADEKIPENIAPVPSDFVHDSMVDGCEIKTVASPMYIKKKMAEDLSSCPPLEMDGENNINVHESLSFGSLAERRLSSRTNAVEESGNTAANKSESNVLKPHDVNDFNSQNTVTLDERTVAENWESKKVAQACDAHQSLNGQVEAAVASVVSDLNHDSAVDESERKEVIGSTRQTSDESPTNPAKESEQRMMLGPKSTRIETEVREECASNAEVSSSSVAAGSDTATKLDFDLNEGFPVDDGNQGEQSVSVGPDCLSAVHLQSTLPSSVPSMSSSLPASITVAAATKGSFVPPELLLKSKGELGWKGSAATSAFRPAEPRKVLEMPLSTADMPLANSVGKQGRAPLDIDLNVADDRVLEDTASKSSQQETASKSGLNNHCEVGLSRFGSNFAPRGAAGLDLDLNKIDEDTDVAQLSVSSIRRLDVSVFPVRSSSSGGFLNGEVNVLRDFDLNNGPGLDEVAPEPAQCSQQLKSSFPSLPPVAGLRMNSTGVSIGSSWFPAGNSYPPITTPLMLPDRSDQPHPIVVNAQRITGPPASSVPLGSDVFRGPVLSSSPAMAFSSAIPFPYPGFPFNSSFSIPATSFSGVSTTIMESSSGGGLCFPPTPSPLVGPIGAVSAHYPRPYVISIPDGPSAAESSRKWGMQGLDLNSGPGGTDMDVKVDRFTSVSRQFPVPTSHTLVEEQVRMLQATGGVLKRKEPEGGWDTQRYCYKQPSRQ